MTTLFWHIENHLIIISKHVCIHVVKSEIASFFIDTQIKGGLHNSLHTHQVISIFSQRFLDSKWPQRIHSSSDHEGFWSGKVCPNSFWIGIFKDRYSYNYKDKRHLPEHLCRILSQEEFTTFEDSLRSFINLDLNMISSQ